MWDMDARGLWNAKRCKYVKLVKSVIQSHKAPSLKQFTMSFYVNNAAKRAVAKWLEFAFSRGVERLVLDLYSKMPTYEVVLEEVLRERGLCSSPKKLILFKSLKSLCIKHVNVSGEAVKIFLRNCPLLEELIIADSNMMSPVEVRGSTLVLKHLEVCNSYVDNYFVVSAPNLTRLKFTVHFLKLFLGKVPKLVEAEILYENEFIHPALNVASESALSRLSSQLEILNLSLHYPKVFLANEFPEMPKLKKLVVEYHGLKTHSLLPVTPLLWACPRLEEFKLVYKENQNFRNGDEATEVGGVGESSGHLHLKLFELEGLVDGADGHIELVNYILDNCVALEKIQISVARSPPDGPVIKNHEQAAGDYARQRLQGKLPQHIQLQIF